MQAPDNCTFRRDQSGISLGLPIKDSHYRRCETCRLSSHSQADRGVCDRPKSGLTKWLVISLLLGFTQGLRSRGRRESPPTSRWEEVQPSRPQGFVVSSPHSIDTKVQGTTLPTFHRYEGTRYYTLVGKGSTECVRAFDQYRIDGAQRCVGKRIRLEDDGMHALSSTQIHSIYAHAFGQQGLYRQRPHLLTPHNSRASRWHRVDSITIVQSRLCSGFQGGYSSVLLGKSRVHVRGLVRLCVSARD